MQDAKDLEAEDAIQQGLDFVERVMRDGSLHGSIIGCAAAAFGAVAYAVRI